MQKMNISTERQKELSRSGRLVVFGMLIICHLSWTSAATRTVCKPNFGLQKRGKLATKVEKSGGESKTSFLRKECTCSPDLPHPTLRAEQIGLRRNLYGGAIRR